MRASFTDLHGGRVIALDTRRAGRWVVGFDYGVDPHPSALPFGPMLGRAVLVPAEFVLRVASGCILTAFPWWAPRWADAMLLLRLLKRDLGPPGRWRGGHEIPGGQGRRPRVSHSHTRG